MAFTDLFRRVLIGAAINGFSALLLWIGWVCLQHGSFLIWAASTRYMATGVSSWRWYAFIGYGWLGAAFLASFLGIYVTCRWGIVHNMRNGVSADKKRNRIGKPQAQGFVGSDEDQFK